MTLEVRVELNRITRLSQLVQVSCRYKQGVFQNEKATDFFNYICHSNVVFIAVLFGGYAFFKKSGSDKIKTEKPIQPEKIAKPGNKYNEEQSSQQIKLNWCIGKKSD